MHHLEIIEEQLISTQSEIYEHMLEELGGSNLYVLFSSFILSIFIYDLQDTDPHTLTGIFDAFLLDCEQVIFVLIYSCIGMKKDVILQK